MSLLFKRTGSMDSLADLIPSRLSGRKGTERVSREDSLRSSVKWACQRLRADLVSTTPLDVFKQRDDMLASVATPEVLKRPDGVLDITEWLYSSQFDLDDCGNAFGLISARDRMGYPARIELIDPADLVLRREKGVLRYFIAGEEIPAEAIWHERQFTVSGSPMGLSPTAYAAMALTTGLSAAQFAAAWFSGQGIPAAHLRNSAKVLNATEAQAVKDKFTTTIETGDVFVTGSDWEYSVIGANASESAFDQAMKVSAQDICRYYGVPGDMVDVESTSGSITYANVTQRNLQFTILNLGPVFTRRERTFTANLTPRGQVVKFNTDALLRMDPMGRAELQRTAIDMRRMTVTEARALENEPPLTPEQEAEFARLFPARAAQTGVSQ